MSRRSWLVIFSCVMALHAALFLVVKDRRAIPPEWLVDRSKADSRFRRGEAKYIDPETGEKMIVREYTVPTKLAEAAPSLPQ